jgi:alkylation response protein AidB-like acyl-CoA dehydrogenase
MDLTLDDEQSLLAATARSFVERVAPDADPWPVICDAGWTGLLVPAEFGGAGRGMLDLVVVCEQLGRGALSSPLVVSGTLAALPIVWIGTEKQRERLLPSLADGSRVGTLALLEPGMGDEWDVTAMRVAPSLSGQKILVPWAARAKTMLVATSDGLRLVEPGASSVDIEAHDAIGGDPLCSVTFKDADSEPLGAPQDGRPVLERALDRAAVAQLAYTVGVAERALELSVRHATDREQFGRPIGSFQAVAHRCVDMRTDVDACRYLTYQAAWALEQQREPDIPVPAAKSYANEAIRRVFLNAHQVHGAIGFSTEHELHHFTTRAKAFELTYGSTSHHRERLASAMGLRP